MDSFEWKESIDWLADRFADPNLVVGIAGSILLLGILGYLCAWITIFRPLGLLLDQATNAVRRSSTPNLIEDFQEKSQKSHYWQVSRNFWELWVKFQRRCYRDTDQSIWFSPQLPDQVFSDDALVRNTRITVFRHLGSYLLSIGLFFTFLGIALVVYRSSNLLANIGADDGMPVEISGMLANTAAKFVLSLAGLSGSLIYSILFRRSIHRLESAISGFCEWMNGAMVDGEQRGFILQDLGYISSVMLRTQASQQKMLSMIAVDMRKATQDSIASAAAKIIEVTKTFGDRMVEINTSGVGRIVDDVAEKLRNELDMTTDKIRQSFLEITTGLETVSARVPEATTQVDRALQRTGVELENLSKGFTARIEDQLNAFQSAGVEQIVAGIEQKLQTGIQQTVDGIKLQFDAITEGLNGVGKSLPEASQRVAEIVATTEKDFQSISTCLVDSLRQFDTSFGKAIEKTQQDLSQALETTENLTNVIKGSFKNVGKTASALEFISTRMEEGSTAISTTAANISSAGDALALVTNQARNLLLEFKSAEEKHTKATSGTGEALAQSANEIAEHLSALEGKILPALQADLDKLLVASQILGDSVGRMSDGNLNRSLDALESASSKLTNIIEGVRVRKTRSANARLAQAVSWMKRMWKLTLRR